MKFISWIVGLMILSSFANAGKLAGTPNPIAVRGVVLSGMMTYMADAAQITLCSTGTTYPISAERGYLPLEKAYLRDRPGPGEPLMVLFEGSLVQRESMEGAPQKMAVVDHFLRTEPEKSCGGQMANASLDNTYWRIDELLDQPVHMDENFRKEPHMRFDPTEDNRYSLSMGCNQMRGRYSLDEDIITFNAAASTMMACPPPVDALEKTIGKALAEVVRYVIRGDTLLLLSQDSHVVVSMTAVYMN